MVNKLFVLYEHAAGYALFKVKEFEEIAMFLPQVEKATLDPVKFKAFIDLVAFLPFKSGTNALDNINSVSEGIIHEDLQAFLETNLPQNKKKKIILGVGDAKIGAAIQETLGYNCQFTDVVPELLRGIRFHFHELVQGLNLSSLGSAECSLGRSYSRAKVKFNVNRADNMVIQSISLVDQLDKDINTFSMRLKEWYSYHFPELVKIVTDNHTYAKVVKLIGDRKEFYADENAETRLEEVIQDTSKVQAIISASKSSMGMDISPIDLINIEYFTSKVISLAEYRAQLMDYLVSRMHNIAPNLSALIGEMVGARLIAHAGSLNNLSKYPSSTVQILGAEKALFRALKKKGNTPKYGLIYHSTFIGRAGRKNKGKISRFLANKCSIASRIDCFADDATDVFGQKLKEQVEERLKFLDGGDLPKKNSDVMEEAMEEAKIDIKKRKKKLKKEKKRKLAEMESEEASISADINGNSIEQDVLINGNEDYDLNNDDISINESSSSNKKKNKKKKMKTENNSNFQTSPIEV